MVFICNVFMQLLKYLNNVPPGVRGERFGVPAGCLRQADFVGVSRKLHPLWNSQRFSMNIDILLRPKTSNFHHFGYIFCQSPPSSN